MPADRWGERLIRRLGLWSAVAVLVGSTIGSGIFRTPASVAQRIDDVPLFLLAWVVGGIVVLCGALTYSELAAAFPRSGGVYVFVRESFGPLPAFRGRGPAAPVLKPQLLVFTLDGKAELPKAAPAPPAPTQDGPHQ